MFFSESDGTRVSGLWHDTGNACVSQRPDWRGVPVESGGDGGFAAGACGVGNRGARLGEGQTSSFSGEVRPVGGLDPGGGDDRLVDC